MSQHSDATPDQLPPPPDPVSGQPEPPRAPRHFGATEHTPTRAPHRHPATPNQLGPMLEWRRGTFTSGLTGGMITAVIVAALPTVEGQSFRWVTHWWWYWIIVLGGALLVWRGLSRTWIAAGATWLQNGNKWVNTYELVEVKIGAAATSQVLRLTDSDGRDIGSLSLRDVQRNPELWNLVHLGIRHSVGMGKADPPKGTRTILQLPGGRGGPPRT